MSSNEPTASPRPYSGPADRAAHGWWRARILSPLLGVLLLIGLNLNAGAAGAQATETAHRAPGPAQSALPVRGQVLDPAGTPVAGATVATADGNASVVTDAEGRFELALAPGEWKLRVIHPLYRTLARRVTIGSNNVELQLRFEATVAIQEWVTVVGIRAGEEVPVTTRNMDREEIRRLSYGQDVPKLLQYTPSVTWYSDSGTGSNYSYFSIRGIQQTRINMTFDGAPLNDPADHALFFNNFHDFASAVDSIQIQRGVGTSSVGSPAYGGSVNFASPGPGPSGSGDIRVVLGSYDTQRASIGYQTGLLDSGFHISGRFSYATSAGYRERSGTEHHTLFLNAGWQGERSSLKLTAFSGDEKTQLAFLAVDPATLAVNRRFNPLDAAERDNFGQDFAQLRYMTTVGDNTLLTGSLYYNGANGWFRLWDDPAQSNLLEFGINQGFWGGMVTASRSGERVSATVGIHYNDFSGDHFLDIGDSRIYDNTGSKKTANAFAKLEVRFDRWLLFGDLQLRGAEFAYHGDIDLGSVNWLFLDPKVGARYDLSPGLSVYGSVGRARREPARLDLLVGEDNATVAHDLEAVKPEAVLDFEVGVNFNTRNLALQANLYAMEFTNEIALTGELSEIGLPLRRNVDSSYRRGLEIDLRWKPAPGWSVLNSLNISRNRISTWTQFYDVFDEQGAWIGSEPITYTNVRPLLTPELVATLGLEWTDRGASIGLTGRYVAAAQLDNTGLAEFRLPALTNLDLRAIYDLGRGPLGGHPRITLYANNLLDDTDQFGSGYSYQFLTRDSAGRDSLDGIPFYYPMATRNVVVSLELEF